MNSYTSYPYPQTHPQNLYLLGKLFNLTPRNYKESNILEIGCASGGNIIPIAYNSPNCRITGIDINEYDVQKGKAQIDELGLKNINLFTSSFTDFKPKENFDYIIIHGLFSWISAELQQQLLIFINNYLSEDGICYLSYNTKPGWSFLDSIRQMMLFHSQHFNNTDDKIAQSKHLLEFITSGHPDKEDYFYKFIKFEEEFINNRPDHYIIDEYLSEYNQAFFFHEIASLLKSNNLNYVCDTSLRYMYIQDLPEEVKAFLVSISNNIILTEQYLDFIFNRRFRSSLICKATQEPKRTIAPTAIKDFFVRSTMHQNISDTQLEKMQQAVFATDNRTILSTEKKHIILLMQELGKNRHKTISINKLIRMILPTPNKELEFDILNTLLLFFIFGGVRLYIDNIESEEDNLDINPLIKLQAKSQNWVTNIFHEKIAIDQFDKQIIPLLNSKNSLKDLSLLATSYNLQSPLDEKINLYRNLGLLNNENF